MSQPEVSQELFNTEELNAPHEIENKDDDIQGESEIIQSTKDQMVEDLENQIQDPEGHEDELMDGIDENDAEEIEGTEELEHETEESEAIEGTETTTGSTTVKKKPTQERLTNLPIAKIKHIIKLDPDVNLVNAEAVFLITKTTELFIKSLAKEAYGYAAQNKKKTIAKNHVESALTMLPVEL